LETFLQAVRFQDAVHLLTILGSVKEAALFAGYSSVAPFCREFARSQGISPGRFFRRYRETQPYWNDPEMRLVRLATQSETREFCAVRSRRSR
jgi:AraC-like DNA-binding protein